MLCRTAGHVWDLLNAGSRDGEVLRSSAFERVARAAGCVPFADTAALTSALRAADEQTAGRMRDAMRPARAAIRATLAGLDTQRQQVDYLHRILDETLRARISEGRLDVPDVALVCAALSDARLVDLAIALCLHPAHDPVLGLWADIVRLAPERGRDLACELLAFTALARPDERLAEIALAQIGSATPPHPALAARVREMLAAGHRLSRTGDALLATAELLKYPPHASFRLAETLDLAKATLACALHQSSGGPELWWEGSTLASSGVNAAPAIIDALDDACRFESLAAINDHAAITVTDDLVEFLEQGRARGNTQIQLRATSVFTVSWELAGCDADS